MFQFQHRKLKERVVRKPRDFQHEANIFYFNDDRKSLKKLAKEIGIKRTWYKSNCSLCHFDIPVQLILNSLYRSTKFFYKYLENIVNKKLNLEVTINNEKEFNEVLKTIKKIENKDKTWKKRCMLFLKSILNKS